MNTLESKGTKEKKNTVNIDSSKYPAVNKFQANGMVLHQHKKFKSLLELLKKITINRSLMRESEDKLMQTGPKFLTDK